jgi:Golgi apyrase
MPPPTASDPWLAGRRFGIVIDAGSSGSRLQIYSWKDPRITSLDDRLLGSLPEVEKGVRGGEGWVSKVEPGVSFFFTLSLDHLLILTYARHLDVR